MSRYRRSNTHTRSAGISAFLAAAFAFGCTNLVPVTGEDAAPEPASGPPAEQQSQSSPAASPPVEEESPVARYLAFMKRAASADGQDRQRIIAEIDQHFEDAPLTARLQMGLLLTSPAETVSNAREGERLLKEILAGSSKLDPALRDLIELRLREVEVRQALRLELGDAKGKIEDLLSIESTMEEQKSKSESQSP